MKVIAACQQTKYLKVLQDGFTNTGIVKKPEASEYTWFRHIMGKCKSVLCTEQAANTIWSKMGSLRLAALAEGQVTDAIMDGLGIPSSVFQKTPRDKLVLWRQRQVLLTHKKTRERWDADTDKKAAAEQRRLAKLAADEDESDDEAWVEVGDHVLVGAPPAPQQAAPALQAPEGPVVAPDDGVEVSPPRAHVRGAVALPQPIGGGSAPRSGNKRGCQRGQGRGSKRPGAVLTPVGASQASPRPKNPKKPKALRAQAAQATGAPSTSLIAKEGEAPEPLPTQTGGGRYSSVVVEYGAPKTNKRRFAPER